MTVETEFRKYEGVFPDVRRYIYDGSVSITLHNYTDGPIAHITKCLGDDRLEDYEAYVDTNNCPWALGLIEKYKMGKPTGKTRQSGYCIYPAVQFDKERLEELTWEA